MDEKKIKYLISLIKTNQLEKLRLLDDKKYDLHFHNDYLLYIAAFYNQVEIQKFLIEKGLDPEITKGRLELAHPEKLNTLRNYKYYFEKHKEVNLMVEKLENKLPTKEKNELKKLKL